MLKMFFLYFYTIFFIKIGRFEDPHIREATRISWNDNGIKNVFKNFPNR